MQNKFKYRLIIALGNPGPEYATTYHNAGWLALDFLIQNLKLKAENFPSETGRSLTEKFKKHDSFQYLKTKDYIFIKPQTFMNESGKAVAAALKYFSAKDKSSANGKIKFEEILIIHDDSDIELGKIKISFGQGAAGHHGVESIIKNLKTKKFWRARIGIRPEASSVKRQASNKKAGLPADLSARASAVAEAYRAKAGGFVLRKITPADKLILEQSFETSLIF
ncbi:MAG: aminoacyl-tRNA hydrolase [Patescibacteria group bacterium]